MLDAIRAEEREGKLTYVESQGRRLFSVSSRLPRRMITEAMSGRRAIQCAFSSIAQPLRRLMSSA